MPQEFVVGSGEMLCLIGVAGAARMALPMHIGQLFSTCRLVLTFQCSRMVAKETEVQKPGPSAGEFLSKPLTLLKGEGGTLVEFVSPSDQGPTLFIILGQLGF